MTHMQYSDNFTLYLTHANLLTNHLSPSPLTDFEMIMNVQSQS
jgi:hypothetical protein